MLSSRKLSRVSSSSSICTIPLEGDFPDDFPPYPKSNTSTSSNTTNKKNKRTLKELNDADEMGDLDHSIHESSQASGDLEISNNSSNNDLKKQIETLRAENKRLKESIENSNSPEQKALHHYQQLFREDPYIPFLLYDYIDRITSEGELLSIALFFSKNECYPSDQTEAQFIERTSRSKHERNINVYKCIRERFLSLKSKEDSIDGKIAKIIFDKRFDYKI